MSLNTMKQYSIKFRCPNCGDIFEKYLQKGVPAQGRGGICPTCGSSDGQPSVGQFKVIRKNQECDPESSPYQGWVGPRAT